MIRAAIFDADGTLLDSMKIWEDAGERYLSRQGIARTSGLGRILAPMTLEEGSRYLREQFELPGSLEEIRAGVIGVIEDFYRFEAQLKPGVREFVRRLWEKGIPMVIATAGDRGLLSAALWRLEMEKYFCKIFTCTELCTTKSEPLIFIEAAKYLGTTPQDTYVFEDAHYALAAARRAGFHTVAIEEAASEEERDIIMSVSDIYLRDFCDFDSFWRQTLQI